MPEVAQLLDRMTAELPPTSPRPLVEILAWSRVSWKVAAPSTLHSAGLGIPCENPVCSSRLEMGAESRECCVQEIGVDFHARQVGSQE